MASQSLELSAARDNRRSGPSSAGVGTVAIAWYTARSSAPSWRSTASSCRHCGLSVVGSRSASQSAGSIRSASGSSANGWSALSVAIGVC